MIQFLFGLMQGSASGHHLKMIQQALDIASVQQALDIPSVQLGLDMPSVSGLGIIVEGSAVLHDSLLLSQLNETTCWRTVIDMTNARAHSIPQNVQLQQITGVERQRRSKNIA